MDCHFEQSSLSLRQLSNHLFITHRAFHHGTVLTSCYSSTDSDFVKNMRILFRNVDIHVLSKNAGFPLHEKDGEEVLLVKDKREASRVDGESANERPSGKGSRTLEVAGISIL